MGRDTEVGVLRGLVAGAAAGRGGAVWVEGEPGIGKSALVAAGLGVSRPVPRSPGVVVARRGVADRGGVVISLEPLPAAEVSAMVAGLVGGRPGPGLLGQAARAGGNPLYVREMVDALVREDRVHVSGGLAEVAEPAGGDGGGLVSLAAAIEDRLGFLSARAVAVLRVAALLGARFSVRDLAVVAGVRGPELAGVVGEAVAAGVLVESGPELVFRHGLIAQALADGMPAGLRAQLHREAARALADAGAAPDRVAAQLREAVAGGEDPDGWVADWLAANAAMLVHRAPQDAADLLGRAVAGMVAGDERREALTEHLVGVLFLLARHEQAEPLARELLVKTGDSQRRARMAWTLVYTLVRTSRLAEALAVADEALRDRDVPDVWRARLRSVRSIVLLSDSRYSQADSDAATALADADRAGDRFAAGWALHVQSRIQALNGDYARALEMTERALAVIGDSPETTDLRLLLMSNRLYLMEILDRDNDAEALELLALADRVGPARGGVAREGVAERLFDTGHWDDALAELDVLFEPGADVLDHAVVGARGLAALIAGHRDDRAGAAAHLRAARELPADLGRQRGFSVPLLLAKAVAAEQDGRPEESRAFLAEVVAAESVGLMSQRSWLADLVRCSIAAGDRPAAETTAASSENDAAMRGGARAAAAAQWCRGLADADPVALAGAVAYYRTVTLPLELGQVLEDLAVARAAAGDVAGAKAALREAVQIYTELGAEWDIRRADARARPYGVRRRHQGTRRPATGWAALTPTETKIAGLVGEGLSNPDIGTRLFLSRNTVQTHMRKIMAKLQARSRLEVAMTALAHRSAGTHPPRADRSAPPPARMSR